MQPWEQPRYRFIPFLEDKIPFAFTKCMLNPSFTGKIVPKCTDMIIPLWAAE